MKDQIMQMVIVFYCFGRLIAVMQLNEAIHAIIHINVFKILEVPLNSNFMDNNSKHIMISGCYETENQRTPHSQNTISTLKYVFNSRV